MRSSTRSSRRADDARAQARYAFGRDGARLLELDDPGPLERLVMEKSAGFSLGGAPVSARLCRSLREAALEPYFYEALFEFARHPRPTDYESWRSARAQAMSAGKELYFLGRP